jgi:hypothetical protein
MRYRVSFTRIRYNRFNNYGFTFKSYWPQQWTPPPSVTMRSFSCAEP